MHEDQVWIAEQVGDLLAVANQLRTSPRTEPLCNWLKDYIEGELGGNAKALGRQVGLHHTTIYDLRDGKQLPQLGTLLKFCTLFRVPLRHLLVQQDKFGLSHVPEDAAKLDVPIIRTKRGASFFDKEHVRWLLRRIIELNEDPPPSMTSVAERLGYDQSFLHKHYEFETKEISSRFQVYIEAETQRHRIATYNLIRNAAYQLHSGGLYPSNKRMGKLTGGALRDPYAREVHKDVITELGYLHKKRDQ